MRVLVCGGRDYRDSKAVFDKLDELEHGSRHGIFRVIQGGASGADALAREWCSARCVPYDNYPAEWGKHGSAAGPIRNRRMLDEGKPDLVLAFPGGRGTANMKLQARAAGIEVIEVPVLSPVCDGGRS